MTQRHSPTPTSCIEWTPSTCVRRPPTSSHPSRNPRRSERPLYPAAMFAVVVSGLPGRGKSTFAVRLAEQLRLPLLSKDHIKEVLADAIGGGSRDLGRAAVA